MKNNDSENDIMIPVYRFTNEIEAQVLSQVLDEEGIPYRVRSFRDSAYNGIYQMQKGWGQLESHEKFRKKIENLAKIVLTNNNINEP
ncbi:MAG: hypothetical protein PHS99_02700 [Candidatus Marinimicrobia bacterium]|jgi:hypothetical protein|nr:hypothetical protein [Candidatus Neomarinimicrobiota bacterium]